VEPDGPGIEAQSFVAVRVEDRARPERKKAGDRTGHCRLAIALATIGQPSGPVCRRRAGCQLVGVDAACVAPRPAEGHARPLSLVDHLVEVGDPEAGDTSLSRRYRVGVEPEAQPKAVWHRQRSDVRHGVSGGHRERTL